MKRTPRARVWPSVVVVVVASMLCARPARADDSATGSDAALPVEVHGFVSQGFLKTTENNYLAASKRGSFEFSEVALNFSKNLTDRMRVGMQLFTHDLGPLGNYRTRFDWFYLDYRFWDWLGVRAGRTKLPFGLYNESSDIDAARVPILLPQSMYPVSNRDYLLAQTGAELYGTVPLGAAGALEYRLYGGTVFFDTADATTALTNVTVPFILGGRLMWQTPLDGLQLGGSVQKLRIEAEVPAAQVAQLQISGALPAAFTGALPIRVPALLGVASAEYSAHDLLVAAEYSRWRVSIESPVPAFATEATTSERFYLMSSYHVRPWFSPGLYYSVLFPDVSDRPGLRAPVGQPAAAPPAGRAAYQHDLAVTLRFDVNPYWIVKLEGHRMHGTAGLTSSLNDNASLSSLTKDWGVFLVKTTAYF
ncbi:MAG: hypothetical protein ABI548_09730 [Polyangiaceae bacterium]